MTYSEQAQTGKKEYAALKEASPEVMGAFGDLHKTNVKDGALTVKEKELIALGIAIATRCEGCILSHMNLLIKEGVSRDEVIETINTAVMMSGGPGTVYGGKALAYFDERQ